MEGCAALGKLLDPADCVANVLPVIVSFSQVGLKLSSQCVHFLEPLAAIINFSISVAQWRNSRCDLLTYLGGEL